MPTQRGNSWQGIVYHASLPTGRARRNFSSAQEAKAWEHDSKARLMRGEPIDMGDGVKHSGLRRNGLPYTLSELVEYVARNHWRPQRDGDKSAINARSIVKLIGPNMPIAKLTGFDVDQARTELMEEYGNSTETVNRKVAALSTCMTKAVELGIVTGKPPMPKYKKREGRLRRFTVADERASLAYFNKIGNDDMRDFVIFGLDTGLRVGEILSLKLSACSEGKITVWGEHAKSGKARTVPLTKRAAKIVEARSKMSQNRLRAVEGRLFGNMDRWAVRYNWDKLRDALDLQDDPQFVPHILRHEFCSRLADRDLNAKVIMELAGHSSLSVTQRYIHVTASHLMRAIKELEGVEA